MDTYKVMSVVPVFDYNDRLCYLATSRELAKNLVREHNSKQADFRTKLYVVPDEINVIGGNTNE